VSTPLNLSGLNVPRRNGELAFDAPWQSTAFALAAAVVEHAFDGDREPFRQQLITAIAADPGRPYSPRSRHSSRPCPNTHALTPRDRAHHGTGVPDPPFGAAGDFSG
jgi:hypothetical protein